MFSRSFFATAAFALCACGPQTVDITDGEDTLAGDELELTTTELKVATTGMTVWLRPYAVKGTRDSQTYWILRGRASVNLDHAYSFVPDDIFCTTTVLTARTFEIACHPAHEANSLLSGLPLFVNLVQPITTAGVAPKQASLKFVLEPRFVDVTGSSKLWLNTEIKPIYVSGVGLTYRGKISATGAVSSLIGGAPAKLTRRAGTNDYNVDVGFDQLANGALTTGAEFTLDLEGVPYTKKASIAYGVKELDLQRTPDAYVTWPSITCASPVQACLNAAPLDIYDYESCGSYRQVSRCNIPSNLPQIGMSPDDRTALDAALVQINATLPANKKVKVTGYWVQNATGGGRPTIAQAVRAWQQVEQGVTTNEGERTAGQVNIDLDAYGARSVVPAIQKVVFQQSFKAMRLKSPQTTWEVLYFSTAARLMVIQLIDTSL